MLRWIVRGAQSLDRLSEKIKLRNLFVGIFIVAKMFVSISQQNNIQGAEDG